MADTKISAMTNAATLTGGEIVPLVQSGANVQQTLTNTINQTIAAGPSTVRTSLGLGTIATQNANAVAITGGTEAGVSYSNIKTPGLTGYLYGNDVNNVTASTTIPASAVTTQYGVFQHNATMTNVTPGTGMAMLFDTTDIGGHGVTVSNDLAGNPTKVTIATAGVYNFQFSAQLNKSAGGGSAADVYIWARLDGVDVPETNTRITLQGANVYTVAAWNLMFNVAAGQYFQLMWGSTDANAVIQYITTPTIGPVVPAVILTVNRVA